MVGELLNAKEASKVLFGNAGSTAYQRTLRLMKSNQIKTVSDGKKMFAIRADLLKILGASEDSKST